MTGRRAWAALCALTVLLGLACPSLALASDPHAPAPGLRPAPDGAAAMAELDTIAREWSARQATGAATQPAPDTLRIFISLAMPEPSLRLLVAQAARSGAVLVMRGLHQDSMRATLAAITPLIAETRVNWVIDPPAFERHGITLVPAFVLAAQPAAPDTCAPHCPGPLQALQIAGDVSLEYALEAMLTRAPQARNRIEPWLSRVRSR